MSDDWDIAELDIPRRTVITEGVRQPDGKITFANSLESGVDVWTLRWDFRREPPLMFSTREGTP